MRNKNFDVYLKYHENKDYNKGWNDAMILIENIAKSVDSKRGNEKIIVRALKECKIKYKG